MLFNPLLLIKYIKYIGIAILIGIIAYVVWDIKNTFNENIKLTQEVKTQKDSIAVLQDDIQLKVELNDKLLARIAEVEKVTKERVIYVDRIKKGDTIYIEKSKKEVEIIKQNNPNVLDKYYASKYNFILECLVDTTGGRDNKCDTL